MLDRRELRRLCWPHRLAWFWASVPNASRELTLKDQGEVLEDAQRCSKCLTLNGLPASNLHPNALPSQVRSNIAKSLVGYTVVGASIALLVPPWRGPWLLGIPVILALAALALSRGHVQGMGEIIGGAALGALVGGLFVVGLLAIGLMKAM